jgi:hypothetical protein
MAQQKGREIKTDISDEVALGIYSNVALLTVSGNDFIFDFGSIVPQRDTCKVQSRIIMSPQHAKRFLILIQNNIEEYEKRFGKIPSVEPPAPKAIGFKAPKE